jgi:PAS domain S-box-containing protein
MKSVRISLKRPEPFDIIDATFDPALLIDKKGRVRHLNEKAEEIFDVDAALTDTHIDALMIFLSSNNEDRCWKDVFQGLIGKPSPVLWTVRCTNQVNHFVFKGEIRLAKAMWTDGNHYVFGYFQTEEVQPARKRDKTFDSQTDPMLAVDHMGTVLMFNQAAVDSIAWCRPEFVGLPLAKCMSNVDYEASSDPILTVDERGFVVTVNGAAVDDVSWCNQELIGQNLLAMRDHHQDGDAEQSQRRPWFGLGKTPAKEDRRKDSPGVVRIFMVTKGATELDDRSYAANTFHTTTEQQKDTLIWAMLEASLDPLFQINEKGIIQLVNRASTRLFGYSREEFLGNNISMIVGGGHAKKHDKYIKRFLDTGITKAIGKKRELMARRSDGVEIPIELGVVEVDTFQGEDRLFCGIVHDLSAMKRKERITNDIVEASLDPMFLITEQGTIRMVNEASVHQFGFSREELEGSNISVIVGGGHAQHHDTYIKNYIATGRTKVIGKLRKLQARRKDGSEFPIQLGVVEMKTTSDEERMFCGFVHDLTEVSRNEQINKGIIESSLDAMFLIDDYGIIEMVNQSAVTIFGWSREEFTGQSISMTMGSHQSAQHEDFLKKLTSVVGARRDLVARKRDQTEFHVEIYIAKAEDPVTKQAKFCCYLKDLSDLLKHKNAIATREHLMSAMINAALDPMFQIDSSGKILVVNNAAVQVFGWTEQELLGSNISIIVSEEHAANHDKYIQRYLETGEKRVMGNKRRLNARRRDGSEFAIELSLTEVVTSEGRMFCGFVRDVSALTEQAEITSGMIDSCPDPMFLIDSSGSIVNVNSAASQNFGYAKEEFMGSNIKMIVGGDHAQYHE